MKLNKLLSAPKKYKLAMVLVPLVLFFIALMVGRYPITPGDIFTALQLKLTGADPGSYQTLNNILFDIRLPRVAAAMLIGAALSVSGAAYQGVFKNPLVSPDLLGVAAGAGFGAAIGIMFSFNMIGIHVISFLFGLLAVALSYAISRNISSGSSENSLVMVLAGILVGTVFTSLISLIKCVADPFNKLPAITFWLMGGLSSITLTQLGIIIIPMLLGVIPLYLVRWRLNILSFGEEEAQSLGINTRFMKLLVITSATLLTAAAVSVSGMIGWVGLVIPHLARALVGPNYKVLIPTSLVLGASFLLVVDTLARVLLPMEIPLGILTALIGAPFFVYLLNRMRRSW